MKLIRQTIERILKVYRSDLDWETKYDVIFSPMLSRELDYLLSVYGLTLDWFDPDASCQDDVLGYVRSIKELIPVIEELEKALENDSSQ